MHIAATAIELDVEGADHDDFAGADNIRHRRIHFRVHVFELDRHDGLPRLFQIDERLLQHHLHHAQFGRREFAALDLGVTAIAAEEIIDQYEYQLGDENDQPGAAQRPHLDHIEAGRHVERMHILAELLNLDAADSNVGAAAQQIEQADTGITRKTLVDH